MKKVCFLLLLAAACKPPVDAREAEYNRLLKISGQYQAAAGLYGSDLSPAGSKHFNDAMNSAKLYLDSAKMFAPIGSGNIQLDSMLKVDTGADKRYNDSVYAARKEKH